ncbi:MAG: endonuclease/exonuclease/phosphatase family protein [Puia sp.]|nr:endonuclease/exonuclease/phosphatase family protein [Puia sp.]
MELKIVTINSWKCDGDYHRRLPVLSGQLKRVNPDIIACQECFFAEEVGADTAARLAAALEMEYSFLPCRRKKREFDGHWVDSYSGMAVLSRFPIVSGEALELSSVPEDPGRKAQRVEIEFLAGRILRITNIHLTHLRGQTALRKKQVAEVCKWAEAVALPGTGAVACNLVCGDFNAVLASAELATLKELTKAADGYSLGGGPEPRTSLLESFKRGRTLCVDYIFCLPVANRYPFCKDAAVVLNEPDALTGLYPSDHFGISVVLVTD